MKNNNYIYNVNYQTNEKELCEIEVRALFDTNLEDKIFFSNKKVDPSISPFLKNRFEIIYKTKTFKEILDLLDANLIESPGFCVKYLDLDTESLRFTEKRELCKEIGLRIWGAPSFDAPKKIFGISKLKEHWYFGVIFETNPTWKIHNSRPYSYSSSLNIVLARVLVNVAGQGDLSKKIIDPCCGVGTVLLEGFYTGHDIQGSDIGIKIAENARENLRHFNYPVNVKTEAIEDINENFDVSIVDLPYGISTKSSELDQMMIIKNAKRISKKVVLVSCTDIRDNILDLGIQITDSCQLLKTENRAFSRYIWVCE